MYIQGIPPLRNSFRNACLWNGPGTQYLLVLVSGMNCRDAQNPIFTSACLWHDLPDSLLSVATGVVAPRNHSTTPETTTEKGFFFP